MRLISDILGRYQQRQLVDIILARIALTSTVPRSHEGKLIKQKYAPIIEEALKYVFGGKVTKRDHRIFGIGAGMANTAMRMNGSTISRSHSRRWVSFRTQQV